MVAFFEAAGARIRTAESTETALARLGAEPYDLVISDVAREPSADEPGELVHLVLDVLERRRL
ncbi:MAG: hypothetical protein MUF27_12315 [Acidobacteria bacterium]|nr:hypothetical protein [Acidobacteriota bacterium]